MAAKKVQPKTPAQNRAIFGQAKKRGLNNEALHILVEAETGKDSIATLTFAEANKVIKALGGREFAATFKPLRTTQHHRQKAGVKQIVTREHLDFMNTLANQLNWGKKTLQKFCLRQIKRAKPTTTEECNKVIEGMKAILSRRPERQQV